MVNLVINKLPPFDPQVGQREADTYLLSVGFAYQLPLVSCAPCLSVSLR